MKLSQALKQKSRLAGEISRQQQILLRENARRSDSTSTVDRQEVWNKIQSLSEELWKLKGKIAKANINIYPALERMAEYKTLITFLKGLNIREGEEIILVGRDQEKLVYKWNSFLNSVSSNFFPLLIAGHSSVAVNSYWLVSWLNFSSNG